MSISSNNKSIKPQRKEKKDIINQKLCYKEIDREKSEEYKKILNERKFIMTI